MDLGFFLILQALEVPIPAVALPDRVINGLHSFRIAIEVRGHLLQDGLGPGVGGMCAGSGDDFPKHMGMVDDHTGTKEVIVIVGLRFADRPEKGALKNIRKLFPMNVVNCKVNEHAGFHISARGDVKVALPSRHASVDIGAIVPEIPHEDRLLLSPLLDLLVQKCPLFRCCHQGRIGAQAGRDILEKPASKAPGRNHAVDERV